MLLCLLCSARRRVREELFRVASTKLPTSTTAATTPLASTFGSATRVELPPTLVALAVRRAHEHDAIAAPVDADDDDDADDADDLSDDAACDDDYATTTTSTTTTEEGVDGAQQHQQRDTRRVALTQLAAEAASEAKQVDELICSIELSCEPFRYCIIYKFVNKNSCSLMPTTNSLLCRRSHSRLQLGNKPFLCTQLVLYLLSPPPLYRNSGDMRTLRTTSVRS